MLARKIYGYTAVISIVFRNYNRAVGKFHVKIFRLPYCMDFSFGASFLSTEGKSASPLGHGKLAAYPYRILCGNES